MIVNPRQIPTIIATRVKAKYSKARQKKIHKKSQKSNKCLNFESGFCVQGIQIFYLN